MRGFVLILFAAVPLFGGTVSTSVTCDGVTYEGSDTASCGSLLGTGASAQVSWMSVNATAWTGFSGGDSSAYASLTGDYILTVTGGYGSGYAEPEFLMASGGFHGYGGASASLGGCSVESSMGRGAAGCPPTSVAFVFGVPQTLAFSESAEGGAAGSGTPEDGGSAELYSFLFFSSYGQPLSGITYSFVDQPPSATPEPGTLPLLTAMACAAFIAFKRRRRSPDRRAAPPAC